MARPSLSQKDLWRVTITTRPEVESFALELLQGCFGASGTVYEDFESVISSVMVYLDTKPKAWKGLQAHLKSQLARSLKSGKQVGAAKVSLQRLKPSGWVNSWKRHCKAFEIGRSLLVKPSWSRKQPKAGQCILVIDPGLSFGTGQHPTTRFCLDQIVKRRLLGQRQSFLDIGTGTGILAMAAVGLGYDPVEAIDFDPEAVRVAVENVQLNQLTGKLRLRQRDVTKLPLQPRKRYDLVCANLIGNLLIAECERLVNRVQPNGFLVLAGILTSEYRAVEARYRQAGFRSKQKQISGEWQSVCLQRSARTSLRDACTNYRQGRFDEPS